MASRTADYRLRRLLEGRPVDRSKEKRTKSGVTKSKTRWEQRNIIAWDGEGANTSDGQHIYNLMANSNGHSVYNPDGLSTKECFAFFLKYGSQLSAINVIYGGSYDVNMILRDLPEDKIRELWVNGHCRWPPFGISYAHRKRFSVRLYEDGNRNPIKRVVLWDVLGFYQTSFVNACREWFGETISSNLEVLNNIEVMKARRSDFDTEQINEIVPYCLAECKLLRLLMEMLFAALDEADIKITRYDGAGAIASALMQRANILSHGGRNERDDKDPVFNGIYYWAQCAYSGGRIEAPKVGNLPNGPIYRDDINSAYPSAALELPSLTGATYTRSNVWDGSPYSMAKVEWRYTKEAPFYPLWYREDDGTILYPREGTGHYWGYEVQLLKDYYEEGKDYNILEAFNIVPATDAKPFTFIRNDYATRLKFKEQGSMAAHTLKLGLNSIYGKLAQQAGYRNGRIPTYHNLLWAGLITSAVRARLYRAAVQHPNDVIAFATDAIISLSEHDVNRGKGLGEWTSEVINGITIVQAGVYWVKLSSGEWSSKYRGFDKDSLIREKIIDCWRNHEDYQAHLTRFCGMGSAIGLNNFKDYWRVWRTDDRMLSLMPQGKRGPIAGSNYADGLCDTTVTFNFTSNYPSEPYPIVWANGDKLLANRMEDGLDIRMTEWEYLDSYA